jgi:hypothetical protein
MSDWAQQRKHAIDVHAADAARREQADTAAARAMIAEFLATASSRGLEPVGLTARSYDGRHRYRTGLRGWYLRADESVAIGVDGEFYVLSVPSSARNRISGARLAPARPRLVLGEGGRDGDRITLRALLDRLLA